MSNAAELQKTWSIIPVGEDNPLQLRAIWPKGAPCVLPTKNITFTASKYPNTEDRKRAFEADALRLNAKGYNSYIVMNPIKPDFCGDAVSDSDIEYRDVVLIDLDRAEKAEAPATDAEVDNAIRVGVRVAAFLSAQGWPDPHRVMSGNGLHLYYDIDHLPNDDTSKHDIQTLLKRLAKEFDTDTTRIDTIVFNASRITKVPGTIARKGVATDDRPYRMARVL